MKILMNAIIERQHTCLYIQQLKHLRNNFIYKKTDTFQNAGQSPLGFYIQKAIDLTMRDFHGIFEVGIYKQKA